MRSTPVVSCDLCGTPGSCLFGGVNDALFGATGIYAIFRCENPQCQTLWLTPRPLEDDIYMAYGKYYTHDSNEARGSSFALQAFSATLALWRGFLGIEDERNQIKQLYTSTLTPGSVLDVGCGNGDRLVALRQRGWQVQGQDVDEAAVSYAREQRGLDVQQGALEAIGYPAEKFDLVLMNHVVEHLYDILSTLAECHRILRPGGTLIAATPNARAFGITYYGDAWRGLEPPRHIRIYTSDSLGMLASSAGFAEVLTHTSSATADSLARGSLQIRRNRAGKAGFTMGDRLSALDFQRRAVRSQRKAPDSGEVLVLIARKQSGGSIDAPTG